ncbi:MAG: hypothetical protein JO314_14005 [Acidobacteria bacterium]|nr:hypothetical protein [Acidobacteriota bacterium]
MRRTAWFSLICLIAVAALTLVRALFPSVVKDGPLKMVAAESESAPSASKSDSLSRGEEAAPDRVVVKTIRIAAVPQAAKHRPQVESSRHAQRAYARMRGRRHHARHRHGDRKA